MKVYQKLAVTLSALKNCLRIHGESYPWVATHRNTIKACMEWSPSGSGFDSGTKLDEEATNDSKLVFNTSFHHMSEHGYYSGWTEHKVSVAPGFCGISIKVSGKNRNDIKDYIADCFGSWLESEYMEPPTEEDKEKYE